MITSSEAPLNAPQSDDLGIPNPSPLRKPLTPGSSSEGREVQSVPAWARPIGEPVPPPVVPDDEKGSSFWNRNKTVINFWLDAILLVLFLVIAWELALLRLAFPKDPGEKWKLLGRTAGDWQDITFTTFCVFALGVVLHVMLHWAWIVATIQTRFLNRKATKDDGTHTMVGVGFLFVLIHIVAAGILWARWAIVEVR